MACPQSHIVKHLEYDGRHPPFQRQRMKAALNFTTNYITLGQTLLDAILQAAPSSNREERRLGERRIVGTGDNSVSSPTGVLVAAVLQTTVREPTP